MELENLPYGLSEKPAVLKVRKEPKGFLFFGGNEVVIVFNDCLVVMGQRFLDWIPCGLTVSDFFFFKSLRGEMGFGSPGKKGFKVFSLCMHFTFL